MNHLRTVTCVALLVVCFAAIGCREKGPPPPLAAENIPAEFEKGFRKAKPSVKELATQVVTALQAKDYPAAHAAAHQLCAAPEATDAEKRLAVGAMLTITTLLQEAQAQGDQKAAEVLTSQKKFK